MKRIGLVLFFLVSGFWLLVTSAYAQTETIEIVTYYPAPYGVYQHIRTTQDTWLATDSGRVGIGTTDPAESLDVDGGNILIQGTDSFDAATEEAILYFGDTNHYIKSIYGSGVRIGTFGVTDAITLLQTSGNVGIGTTSPSAELDIGGTDGTSSNAVQLRLGGAFNQGPNIGNDHTKLLITRYDNENYTNILQAIDENDNTDWWVRSQNNSTNPDTPPQMFFRGNAAFGGIGFNPNSVTALRARGERYGLVGVATTNSVDDLGFGGSFSGVYRGIRVSTSSNIGKLYPEICGYDHTLTLTTASSGVDYGRLVFKPGYTDTWVPGMPGCDSWIRASHWLWDNIWIGLLTRKEGNTAAYPTAIISTGDIEIDPENDGGANGTVRINGSLNVNGNPVPDLAEPFDLLDKELLEEGDVVVISSKDKAVLKRNTKAYNTNVAGVISSEKSATLVIGQRSDGTTDKPLALAGRIYCKVTTENGPIKSGDLLTTSATPGHAMKAKPIGEINGYPIYPQGCIVGKALEPLKEGKAKILVLVCLQ